MSETKMRTTSFKGVYINYFIKDGKDFYLFRDLNKALRLDDYFTVYSVDMDDFAEWFFTDTKEIVESIIGCFISGDMISKYIKASSVLGTYIKDYKAITDYEAGNTSEEKENTEEKSMDNNLQVIYNQEVLGKEFKIYGTKENPLFLAKDVAEWIDYAKTGDGYRDVSRMLKTVDEDEKVATNIVRSDGRAHNAWFLTEDGVYEVLMLSRKPIAKQFKHKVKEILKTIRKTGKYEVEQSPEMAMARGLIAAQEIIKAKDEQIKVLTPKAEFADQLMLSDDYYSFDQLASKLSDAGIWRRDSLGKRIPVSRNYVYAVLRSDGFLTKERAGNKFKNRPYAKYTGGDTKYFTFRIKEDEFSYLRNKYSKANYSDAQLISWYGKAYITQEGMRYFLDNKEMFRNREVDYKRNVWQMCV